MKKRTKILITLAVACVGAFILGACSTGSPYPALKKQRGLNVKVHFNVNGGRFAGQDRMEVVDVYSYETVQKGLQLLAPDDPKRGSNNVTTSSRSGYFLAGWYAAREARVNEDGAPLDEDGNICVETPVLDENGNVMYDDGREVTEFRSENGKLQSYTYSKPWTFGDKLTVEDLGREVDGFYEFTLYAAWIPNYSYRIFAEVEGDWQVVATTTYNPEEGESLQEVPVPVWNDETGAMDYGNFPRASYTTGEGNNVRMVNLTFSKLFTDKTKTEETDRLVHHGSWDKATGVSTGGIEDYYAEYIEGDWYKIRTAAQLAANMKSEGCYDILDDLVFDETTAWPANIVMGDFNGTIRGNDHKIVGASATCSNTSASYGGLFGRFGATTVIENLTFENVIFHLEKGSRIAGASFGLLAGIVSPTARLENVKVTGILRLGMDSTDAIDMFGSNVNGTNTIYSIGKVSGSTEVQSVRAIDASGIEVEALSNVVAETDSLGNVKVTRK